MAILHVIVSVLVLTAAILILFAYIPMKLRSYRFGKIAFQFGLNFDSGKIQWASLYDSAGKRNHLTGTIGSHRIEIYDFNSLHSTKSFKGLASLDSGIVVVGRYTVISIDGVQVAEKGTFGYLSPRKVRAILVDLQKRS